ncbi:hypothetical protein SVAN01_11860 [Stagonosporopsis vannaccii]|nr:hypothetical protein SVAN01_11860 [Stagonosporopsis vannaccii]
MALFVPFALALAVFWLVIGIMLAKFFAQKYKGKPWKSRSVDSSFLYGSALQNDRSSQVHSGGYGYGGQRANVGGGFGREGIQMGQFGAGRVKGM